MRVRRVWRVAMGGLLVALLGLALAVALADRWVMRALAPAAGSLPPPAPDYALAVAWAARPDLDDAADVALPELPAADQAAAPADVFYLHPTTSLGPSWNAAIDDPAVVEATVRGGTLIQASAFNACCAVYAPRYRQAHGKAFVAPSAEGAAARDLAFADVVAAFARFQALRGAARPFILAGHSQGAVLGGRLLREVIWPGPARQQLVAAYLIGSPLRLDSLPPDLPLCDGPEATACVVSYNARGPRSRPNQLDFFELQETADGTPRAPLACVNPLSWRADEVAVPATAHAGALFLDASAPAVIPGFAAAACQGGRLLLTDLQPLPPRDLSSAVLLWILGPENYHPIEYQLFYLDLRRNARARVQAWLRAQVTPASAASQPAQAASLPAAD